MGKGGQKGDWGLSREGGRRARMWGHRDQGNQEFEMEKPIIIVLHAVMWPLDLTTKSTVYYGGRSFCMSEREVVG